MVDEKRVRADTPGARGTVFLDSAGSSLPPAPVLDTMIGHLRREAEVGGYRAAAERADDLAGLRSSLATLIGSHDPGTIALTDSASRAWTQFFYGVPLHEGDKILIGQAEYASNAVALIQRARQTGAIVESIPSDPLGRLDVRALEQRLDERVRLVSLVHVPSNGGLVNPVREVCDLVHRVGGLVLLDACQSVGQLAVNGPELDVDALSATGRKWLRAPRGTGFLYVRPELIGQLEPPAIDLHSAEWISPDDYRLADDARRFELWEANIAGRLGLKAAVDYLLELGVDEVETAVRAKADRLRAGLSDLPGVTVTDLGTDRCGIVTFTVAGRTPEQVRDALRDQDIIVSVSYAFSTLLDMTSRKLDSVVRASPHYFVSDSQLAVLLDAVRRMLNT